MTLSERLAHAEAHAVRLYAQRQQVEAQRQQLQAQAFQIDQSLLKSDGAIEILTALIAAEKGA